MDISTFVNITSRAWALPILAHMGRGVPGRQAPLIHATGAGRTAFANSMKHLVDLGLVERNPGHGHPLRPEFRLTEVGRPISTMASRILNISMEQDHALLRRNWTLPVLSSLHRPSRFIDIKRDLTGITDRALSQSLNLLENREWVHRDVDNAARPPRPIYTAINAGAQISQIVHPASMAIDLTF